MIDYLPRNGAERAAFGVTMTFENEHGELLTLAHVGPMLVQVQRCCDEARVIDPTYRVVSISTPETIYRDFVGRPISHGRAPILEGQALARIGEAGMLHERYARRRDEKWSR